MEDDPTMQETGAVPSARGARYQGMPRDRLWEDARDLGKPLEGALTMQKTDVAPSARAVGHQGELVDSSSPPAEAARRAAGPAGQGEVAQDAARGAAGPAVGPIGTDPVEAEELPTKMAAPTLNPTIPTDTSPRAGAPPAGTPGRRRPSCHKEPASSTSEKLASPTAEEPDVPAQEADAHAVEVSGREAKPGTGPQAATEETVSGDANVGATQETAQVAKRGTRLTRRARKQSRSKEAVVASAMSRFSSAAGLGFTWRGARVLPLPHRLFQLERRVGGEACPRSFRMRWCPLGARSSPPPFSLCTAGRGLAGALGLGPECGHSSRAGEASPTCVVSWRGAGVLPSPLSFQS